MDSGGAGQNLLGIRIKNAGQHSLAQLWLRPFVLFQWQRCRDAAGWRNNSARSTVGWDARKGCLLKGKRGGEQVKRGRSEQTLESSTNSDGSFIRGRLRDTKLCLLHHGSAKN